MPFAPSKVSVAGFASKSLRAGVRARKGLGGRSMSAFITAVSRSPTHEFSKTNDSRIALVTGLGVHGDAHLGETVQHLVRVREDPTKPNLRQVHLIPSELFEDLRPAGFSLSPGPI